MVKPASRVPRSRVQRRARRSRCKITTDGFGMRSTDHGNYGSRVTVIQIAAPPLDDWAVAGLPVDADSLAALFVELGLCERGRPGTVRSDENRAVDELEPDRQLDRSAAAQTPLGYRLPGDQSHPRALNGPRGIGV
jgi:hypothetical protein